MDILTFYTRRISDTSRYIHFAAVMMVMTDCRLRCHHQISPITKCHNIKCRSAFMQHVPKHRVFIGKYFPIFPEYFRIFPNENPENKLFVSQHRPQMVHQMVHLGFPAGRSESPFQTVPPSCRRSLPASICRDQQNCIKRVFCCVE